MAGFPPDSIGIRFSWSLEQDGRAGILCQFVMWRESTKTLYQIAGPLWGELTAGGSFRRLEAYETTDELYARLRAFAEPEAVAFFWSRGAGFDPAWEWKRAKKPKTGPGGEADPRSRKREAPAAPRTDPREALKAERTLFGLKPGFTADELKKAYRRLAKKHHPDRGGSEVMMKAINVAREILEKALSQGQA